LRQERLIRRAGVAPHDAAPAPRWLPTWSRQYRSSSFDQARVGEPLQDPREDGFVRFEIDQAAGPRNRRMIRRRLWQLQLEAEKGVLVASDGRSRRLAAPARPDGAAIAGDGWTFKAAPGWVVREGSRRGDYEIVRQQP
jgi:hypothetical protein